MKKVNLRNKVVIAIMAIIIIAGGVIIGTTGFNFDLRFSESKRIDLYLQKDFEISDIKQITDEVLANQQVIIQKVEVYEDEVAITTTEITDEQKNQIVSKVNEKYGTSLVAEDITVETIPNTKGRDLIKPYVLSFIISTVIILIYLAVKYYKLNWWKVMLKTVAMTALIEALLISVIAITRIPVGRLTIPMVITAYMLTLIGMTTKFEKQLDAKKKSKKKQEKDILNDTEK